MNRYGTHWMASTLPDLNLKTVVYASPVDNKEALHHHTVDACKPTCNNPGIF
jgi:hypothetical protein